VELINYLKNHTQREAADEFTVSLGTISNIKKWSHEYIEKFNENAPNQRKRKMRKTENEDINEYVFSWFKKAADIHISGRLLQEVAKTFAEKFYYSY